MYKLLLLLTLLSSTVLAADKADLIIYNGRIATMVKPGEFRQAVAMKDGIILGAGSSDAVLREYKNGSTRMVDAGGRTVIPGINDSHIHLIREGLNYNAELRWDGVR